MSRMFGVLVVIMMFAASLSAADLVSMKLCATKDYDAAARDCAPAKGMEGKAVQVDASKIDSVQFLTAVKTSQEVEIYHVWSFGKSTSKVTVYDSATKTLRDPDASELTWLKDRGIVGARVIVKMTASASERFRLRSSKNVTPALAGLWKVQIYEATETKPLGEMDFTVVAADKGITD